MLVKLNNCHSNYNSIFVHINLNYDDRIKLVSSELDIPDLEFNFVNGDQLKNLETNKHYITETLLDENFDDNNILSMYWYFTLLNCNIQNMDMTILSYMSNVFYNYILIKTNLERKYPVVLDIISSVYYLIKNKKSLSRFGDGEIAILNGTKAPYNEEASRFINIYLEILGSNSNSLMVGLVDIFNESSKMHWVLRETRYWFSNINKKTGENKWREKMLKVIPKEKHTSIYLCSNISRNQHYLNINTGLYYEFFSRIFINKNVVVVANKDKIFNQLLPSFLFPCRKITFIVCKESRCSDDEDFIYEKCILFGKGKLTLAFAGLYATKLAYQLSLIEDYQCIDSGSFNFLKESYSFDFLYGIQNILYLFYYTVINSRVNYVIVDDYTSKEPCYVIHDNLPLTINFDLPENKLSPNSDQFKIHFNLPNYLYQFDTVLCNIHIKTNQRCSLFTGYSLIEFNGDYKDKILFNFKNFKWYITPSFDEKKLIINNCILNIAKIC
jgi:hypothetical protein